MKNLELRIMRRESRFSILNSKFLIGSIVFALIASIVGISRAEEGLRFRFHPGDRFYLVSVIDRKISQVVDGNRLDTSQTVRVEGNFDIDEVEESGAAWARYIYRRVVLKIKGPGSDVDYDSNVSRAKIPPQAMPLAMAVGEEIYMKLTPQGLPVQINGLRDLIISAKSRIPDRPGIDWVIAAIEDQFVEQQIRYELEDRFAVFPPASTLAEGEAGEPNESGNTETWSRTEHRQIGDVNVVIERTFRLNQPQRLAPKGQRGDGIAIVDVNIVTRTDVNTGETVFSGVRSRHELSSQATGQIEIEESTGRIVNSTITEDAVEEIKVYARGPVLRLPAPPEPMTMHSVTTFQMSRRQDSSAEVGGRKADLTAPKPPDTNQPSR